MKDSSPNEGRVSLLIALAFIVLVLTGLESIPALLVNPSPSWKTHLQWVDEALAVNDTSRAVLLWRDAYGAALGSGDWEAMLAVGDASVRIGQTASVHTGFDAKARQSYLTALFRARQQRSLEGVLRTTEAFAALGDDAVVAQGLHIAEEVAGRDLKGLARVRGLAERFNGRSLATNELPPNGL